MLGLLAGAEVMQQLGLDLAEKCSAKAVRVADWDRTGAEKWLPVRGYEGCYEVSSDGVVRRFGKSEPLSLQIKSGYETAALYVDGKVKRVLVHRLVLSAFRPIEDSILFQCNHLNGIKTDNRIDNLEWTTASGNQWHSFHILGNRRIANMAKRGAENPRARAVARLDDSGVPIEVFPSISDAIANGFHGPSVSAVCLGKRMIHHGSRWAYA